MEALIPRADHNVQAMFEGGAMPTTLEYQKLKVEIVGISLSYSSCVIEDPAELSAILASKTSYIADTPLYVSVSLEQGRMEDVKVRIRPCF